MNYYELCNEKQYDITTIASIRQNPWEKAVDKLRAIQDSNRIHIPFSFSKKFVEDFNDGKLKRFPNHKTKDAHTIANDRNIIIPDTQNRRALIVKLKSTSKGDNLNELSIAVKKPRICGHDEIVVIPKECHHCKESIKQIFPSSDKYKEQENKIKGYDIEKFYGLYRDCEILGEIDCTSIDMLSLASPSSVTKKILYFRKVSV